MPSAHPVLLALAALLTATPPVPSQERLGSRARAIEIVGTSEFTPAEILRELRSRPSWWELTHPRSPLAPWMGYVRDEVLLGYRWHGFPHAKVEIEKTADGVRVAVTEGERFTAGRVRVTGNREIPTAAVVDVLTKPYTAGVDAEPMDPFWTEGQPAVLGERAADVARTLIGWAARDIGRYGVEVRIDTKLNTEGRYDLTVHFESEGRPLRIGRIVFEGDFSDDPEQVAKRFGIAEGMQLTRKLHRRLARELSASGRYSRVDLDLDPEISAEGKVDPFTIRLDQVRNAPPFGEMPWDDLAALRRGRAWLLEFLGGKGYLEVDYSPRSDPESAHGFSRATMALSRSGGLFEVSNLRIASHELGSISIALSSDAVTVYSHRLRAQTTMRFAGTRFWLSFDLELPSDGDDRLQTLFGFGFNNDPSAAPMRFGISDRALLYVLHSPRFTKRIDTAAIRILADEGGKAPAVAVGVDRATGRVQADFEIRREERGRFRARLVEGSADGRLRELASLARERGYLRLDGSWVSEQVASKSFDGIMSQLGWPDELCEQLCNAAIRGLVRDRATDGASTAEAISDRFEFAGSPGRTSAVTTKLILRAWATMLEQNFPVGTWPQCLCREVPDLLPPVGAEMPERFREEFLALYESPKVSAVGHLALARVLGTIGQARIADAFAHKGLERLAFEHTWADLRSLCPEGSFGDRKLRSVGRAWRDLASRTDSVKKLFAGVAGDDPLAWARVGLEHLWNDLFQSRVRAELGKLAR